MWCFQVLCLKAGFKGFICVFSNNWMHCYKMYVLPYNTLCQIVFTGITEPQNLIWNLFFCPVSLWRLRACSDNTNKVKKEAEVLIYVSSFTINFLLLISGIKNFRNLWASLGHIMILAEGNNSSEVCMLCFQSCNLHSFRNKNIWK